MNNTSPSLQDFSLIKSHIDKIQNDYNLTHPSLAFYYLALDLILNLQDDEIDDAITDNFYLKLKNESDAGHDRGIDAVYVDSTTSPQTIHLFNFKYCNKFEKTISHFPSNEIDKVINFLNALMQQDINLKNEINKALFSKVEEIWSIFDSQNPNFVIHICCNYYNGFENAEKKRFEKEINKFSYFQVNYHLMNDFVGLLTHKFRKIVGGKIRAIDKNFFEKSDGDIRALVVDLDARDIIRLVIDDENIRNSVELDNYEILKNHTILEDAFEDNVRVYLKLRTKINRNIKETALSDENHRIFYFNNGITITCDQFSYPKGRRAPIIELENIQIVNGSQTIHALYEAFCANSSNFEDIDLLCRIYQTNNSILSTSIAEYTNSQNPVKTRDIRSNDYIQKKIASELETKGFYYERKKGQYQNKLKHKRIDAEKTGQILLALFNKLPAEAKDKKRLIFAEMYDEVFNDNITSDHVLLGYFLFDKIEDAKKDVKSNLYDNPEIYDNDSFILHSSYYFLYLLGELAEIHSIDLTYENINKIWSLYDEAKKMIKTAVNKEQDSLKGYREKYTHRVFFKGNKPKIHIEDLLLEYQKVL